MRINSVKHLFPQLFLNGYTPLPNYDKRCMLKNWPKITVDEAQVRAWARQLRWPGIGLRMKPPMLVLDNDLPDQDIANAVRGLLPPAVAGALERVGSPPKVAFFLRMDGGEPFHELHTRRFHFEEAPKVGFACQAFSGGGGGQQFGAFGPHSRDDDGAVIKSYSWVGDRSPATVPLADLPSLTRAEVAAFLDAADEMLSEWPGLVLDEQTYKGGAQQRQVYDLNDAMVFRDADGVTYTLKELERKARALQRLKKPAMRLTGSFTGDMASSGSARCKVTWGQQKGLSIIDFKTDTTHRRGMNMSAFELNELLRGVFPKAYAEVDRG